MILDKNLINFVFLCLTDQNDRSYQQFLASNQYNPVFSIDGS